MRERAVLLFESSGACGEDAAFRDACRNDTVRAVTHPSLRADRLPPAAPDTLSAALQTAFEAGYASCLVLDSRLPHVPVGFLTDALGRIERQGKADIVVGPDDAATWYLLALPRSAWERARLLLRDISNDPLLDLSQTIERGEQAGLRVELLPPWYAIRTPGNKDRLKRDLRRGVAHAPETSQF